MKRYLLLLILSFGLAACGTDDAPENDGPRDSGSDAAIADSGTNDATAPSDAGDPNDGGPVDLGRDMESVEDSGTDMGEVDSGVDMGEADAGTDGGADMEEATYDVCAGAIDVTAGGTFNGTTTGQSEDYSNNCVGGSLATGPDVAYTFTPAADTSYTFVVTPAGASYDPMLYIVRDCQNDAICEAGTVLNGSGEVERLSDFAASAGTTYFLVVDGELFSAGDFTLEVTIN